jgi:hypothetical protein
MERAPFLAFVSMQDHYNLLAREEEREMIPLELDEGVGTVVWSPLARGRLARPWGERKATKRGESDGFADMLYTPLTEQSGRAIIDAVGRVADAHGVARAQIALAWLRSKPVVTAPLVGASSIRQVDDAMASVDIELSDDQMLDVERDYTPRYDFQGVSDDAELAAIAARFPVRDRELREATFAPTRIRSPTPTPTPAPASSEKAHQPRLKRSTERSYAHLGTVRIRTTTGQIVREIDASDPAFAFASRSKVDHDLAAYVSVRLELDGCADFLYGEGRGDGHAQAAIRNQPRDVFESTGRCVGAIGGRDPVNQGRDGADAMIRSSQLAGDIYRVRPVEVERRRNRSCMEVANSLNETVAIGDWLGAEAPQILRR